MLYQVWDLSRNDVHSYYSTQLAAEEAAARLNDLESETLGAIRFLVGEAND